MQMVLRSFGVIFLALGVSASIIELLSLRFGTGHREAVGLAIAALVIGAILFGAGTMMRRQTA